MIRAMLSFAFALLFSDMVHADTINVPADQPTVQAGIDTAKDGDIVQVASGTYTENIDFKGKAVLVCSTDGPGATVLDGCGSGSVVVFVSGEDCLSVIDGFTLTNGQADKGGGIYCDGSSPAITNNIIAGNTGVYWGGGICCDSASPVITGNTFSGNSSIKGGGLHCYSSSPAVTGNTFFGNTADDGGAIYCSGSSPGIHDNTIESNTADDGGGAVYCYGSSPAMSGNTVSGNDALKGGGIYCFSSSPSMSNNTVSDNNAKEGGGISLSFGSDSDLFSNTISNNTALSGGGIYCRWSSPTIAGNTVLRNEAYYGGGIYVRFSAGPMITGNIIQDNIATAYDGGGIYCYDEVFPHITGNIITGNSAGREGGGISLHTQLLPPLTNNIIKGNSAEYGGGIGGTYVLRLRLANNTIHGNTADFGGGLSLCGCKTTVANTILWENSAAVGPEIHMGTWMAASLLNISYSDVCRGLSSVYVEPGSVLNWKSGMIDADPLFIDPVNNDYHLSCASPCIDAGDNFAENLPALDFEGDPRKFPGNGIGVFPAGLPPQEAVADMGADEYCLMKRKNLNSK